LKDIINNVKYSRLSPLFLEAGYTLYLKESCRPSRIRINKGFLFRFKLYMQDRLEFSS